MGAPLASPITRLYLTHFHPDHMLGAAALSSPIYALATVAAKIAAVGDRVDGGVHEKHGDVIPTRGTAEPDHRARYRNDRRCHAENENALMVGLPDLPLIDAENRHDIAAVRPLVWAAPR